MRFSLRSNNSLLWALVGGGMVAVSVYRYPVAPGMIRLSMGLLFELLLVALLACTWVWRANRYAGLFLLLAGFSMVYPVYGKWSFLGFHDLCYGLLFYAVLVLHLRAQPERVRVVLDAFCIIALANLLFVFLQVLLLDPIYLPLAGAPVGLMSNQNEASAVLAFSLPAFLRPRWRYFVPGILLGLVLTKTFSGALSVSAGAIAYLLLEKRFRSALAVAALSVIGGEIYAVAVDSPGLERWPVWVHAVRTIFSSEHHPALYVLFGAGLGHWPWVMEKAGFEAWWTMAHNAYLQAFFQMGVGFPVLLALYVRDGVKRYRPEANLAVTAAVVVAVNIAVNFAINVPITAMMIIAWAAVLEATLRQRGEP